MVSLRLIFGLLRSILGICARATGVPLRWHVITTLPRLMLEIVPTVLLAATIALRGDDEGDAPAKLSG